MSLEAGTGAFRGAAGVKIAKLCVEQDQIGRRWCDPHLPPGQIARGFLRKNSQRNDNL